MKTVLQIFSGLIVCIAIATWLIYSSVPMFWEHETQSHVYSITWRSGLVFLLILAVTQWVSFLVFRRIFLKRRV
jgi:hypothetical protein